MTMKKTYGSKWARAMLTLVLSAVLAAALSLPAFAKENGAAAGNNVDTYMSYFLMAVIVVGLAAAAAVIAAIRSVRKKTAGKIRRVAMAAVSVVLAAAIVAANVLTTMYSGSLNTFFVKGTGNGAGITSDRAQWMQLVYDIADEGMVLMENKDHALPLAQGAKVNLLGYHAYNPFYSGSGANSISAEDSISIVKALEDAGFQVNPTVQELYPVQVTTSTEIGFHTATLSFDEISIDKYTGKNSFDQLKDFSDIAIVTIGRTGGEGFDLTAFDGNYLALNENEEALLVAACDTFDTVIVVLNTANALEMGFVDEYDVDAVIWAGEPGPYGFESLGHILNGSANPSGRLPDTWVYDNYSAPAMENFGEQEAANAAGRYYVDYVEGIYVGYKWYETAYAESAVITSAKTGRTYDYSDYDSIVKYPFGYGLSYSTFEQEIAGGSLTNGRAMDPRGEYTVEVKVTNTGSAAGKEVVQLYMTAPYTGYDKENGIEKAAVQLVAYGKTGVLQPNESETVTLTIKAEELASYDAAYDNGDGTMGTYMLDAGSYEFSVRSDAHTAIESIVGTVENRYVYSGENGRDSDHQTAYNQFADAARGIYLSRKDAFANYAQAMGSVKDTIESDVYATTVDYYDAQLDEMVTRQYVEGVDYGASGDLTLSDMVGVDYDDPKWEELIKQIPLSELSSMLTDTLFAHAAVPSVGVDRISDSDGSVGITSMFNPELTSVGYPCIPLLAATFNDELADRYGSYVADQAHSLGISGWYAPSMNMHRTAYSGRNNEYYSEDAVLAAGIAAAETQGARAKGLIVYMKHFALNDSDTHRAYVHTYSNEQAIREIYLKPFESTVKQGGATGVMTSMNYIGDVYAGARTSLLTEVLRNEWGFKGSTITDMDEGGEIRSINACLRAGTDCWLGLGSANVSTETDADIYYLQRAAHHILYMEANANMLEIEVANWQLYVTVLSVELGIIAAACLVSALLAGKGNRRNEAAV